MALQAPWASRGLCQLKRPARLAHMARDMVWTGLARLEELGLIRRVKQRIRIGWVSLQATSLYIFGTSGRSGLCAVAAYPIIFRQTEPTALRLASITMGPPKDPS